MGALLIGLTGLAAPGFAHGLLGQRRAMWIVIAAIVASLALVTITVWALGLAVAILVGSMVDAGLRYRRLGDAVRYRWVDPLIAFVVSISLAIAMRALVVEAFRLPSSSMYPTLQIGDHIFVDKLTAHRRSPRRGELIVFRHPCSPAVDYVSRVIAVGGDTVEVRCSIVYVNGAAVTRTLVDANASYLDTDYGSGSWSTRKVSRYRETLDGASHDVFHDAEQPLRDDRRRTSAIGDDSKDFPSDTLASCGSSMMERPQAVGESQPGKLVSTGEQKAQCAAFRHYVVPADHVFVLGDNRSNSNDSRYWGSVPYGNVKGRVVGIWLPIGRFGAVD